MPDITSTANVDGNDALAADDCLGCRVTGTATLLAVSGYFFHERSKLPRSKAGERRWLLTCTGVFAAAGLWRATTGVFRSSSAAPTQEEEKKQA